VQQPGGAQIGPQGGRDRAAQEVDVGLEFGDAPRPGMIAATAGWASGNCSAAAASGRPWLSHIAPIAFTRATISGGALA
jgi:hypothetical protein